MAEEILSIETEGFDKLVEKLEFATPELLNRMAHNVDANIAAEGRLKEQSGSANRLSMGRNQVKSRHNQRVEGTFSKWDGRVGWVSLNRQAGKGNTGFRMANFAWERAKPSKVTAGYTNQLANLWANETKPYEKRSPLVGHGPGNKNLGRWAVGQRRPPKYSWSTVYNILSGVIPDALSRTEKQFEKELKEV